MTSIARVRAKEPSAGLSLVELMVAMLVGSLLMGGVIQVFINVRSGYQLQQARVDMNESQRFAVDEIASSLRMAGHWGGVPSEDVSMSGIAAVTGDCGTNWTVTNAAIGGEEGNSTTPLSTCIAQANYQPGTDMLVVRYASSTELLSLEPASTSDDPWVGEAEYSGKAVVRVSRTRTAMVMPGANVATYAASPSAAPASMSHMFSADGGPVATANYVFETELYFVSPCTTPGANNVCDANDDGGEPRPTLARLRLDSGALVREAVAPGVEDLQVEYGIDLDDDDAIDRYVSAADVAGAGGFDLVREVRFGLVLRSEREDLGINQAGRTFELPGKQFVVADDDDRFFTRTAMTRSVQIRNAIRR